ncbi:hypothetical protein RN607_00510 [Demequina capsici]|uniref:Uncharacterized protein n=1 Tax=Demequina capsici TaxID=3075620 RepID=A0AA96FDC3_9MICO|nr:hypothetical protein [Demequina sp. PMTSA13]WNM27514.1 hypothetical protein RN607_00510 [Demequina sp. PMTSA13]
MTARQAIRSAHADGYDALDAPTVFLDALANLPRLARTAGWRPVLGAFAAGWRDRRREGVGS